MGWRAISWASLEIVTCLVSLFSVARGHTSLHHAGAPLSRVVRNMDREITKIIDKLEELKLRATELGDQRESFLDNIKAAEAILEVARDEVNDAKRQKGSGT